MIPDGSKSQNLPVPFQTLAAILHYQVKNKAGIKVSIVQTVKLFATHNTGWCILSDTASHGAASHHDSMLMTLPCQIR